MLSERTSTIAYPLPAISRRTIARIDRYADGSAYVQINVTLGTHPSYAFHEDTIYQKHHSKAGNFTDLALVKDVLQRWGAELTRSLNNIKQQLADIEPPTAPEGEKAK